MMMALGSIGASLFLSGIVSILVGSEMAFWFLKGTAFGITFFLELVRVSLSDKP